MVDHRTQGLRRHAGSLPIAPVAPSVGAISPAPSPPGPVSPNPVHPYAAALLAHKEFDDVANGFCADFAPNVQRQTCASSTVTRSAWHTARDPL